MRLGVAIVYFFPKKREKGNKKFSLKGEGVNFFFSVIFQLH